MAKLKMFSAYDSKLKIWMNPMFFQHAGQAERTWMDIVNEPKSLPSKHPEDFTLYQIGEFDDETGECRSIVPPVLLMTSLAAKEKPQEGLPFDGKKMSR